MPRRSSSQSHRLVELFKEAEKNQFTPPPVAVEPTPEPTPPPTPEQPEEQVFDYFRWQQQVKATRLAIPAGSLRSKAGKRHAEAIFHYLEIGEYQKIAKHKWQGIHNPPPNRFDPNSAFLDPYAHRLIV